MTPCAFAREQPGAGSASIGSTSSTSTIRRTIVDEAFAGAHRALVDLREQGVIGAVSLGTNFVKTAEMFLDRGDLDCVLLAGRYTLLDQTAAPVIRQCAERGVAYLAAGVFNSGVLARPTEGAWYDYAPAARAVLDRARRIEQVCERHGVALPAAALSFPFMHPDVTVVIVGMATPDEVDAEHRGGTRRRTRRAVDRAGRRWPARATTTEEGPE